MLLFGTMCSPICDTARQQAPVPEHKYRSVLPNSIKRHAFHPNSCSANISQRVNRRVDPSALVSGMEPNPQGSLYLNGWCHPWQHVSVPGYWGHEMNRLQPCGKAACDVISNEASMQTSAVISFCCVSSSFPMPSIFDHPLVSFYMYLTSITSLFTSFSPSC